MNRGQSSARAKSPRKSSHKRGVFKLTPAKVKARGKAFAEQSSYRDQTKNASRQMQVYDTPPDFDSLPTYEDPPCPI